MRQISRVDDLGNIFDGELIQSPKPCLLGLGDFIKQFIENAFGHNRIYHRRQKAKKSPKRKLSIDLIPNLVL
jgi:hypothetical protein